MPFQTLLWQKLAFSSTFFYFNYQSSISLFRRHCDVALFNPSFCSVKIMLLSFAYPFNRSVVSPLQVLFILSSLASLFNRSVVRIWSSLFLVYLVSTRVFLIPSCPWYSSFIALQPPRFTCSSLFLFSTAVFSIVFNSVVFFLSTFQPLKVLWFHSLVGEAT